MTPHIVKAGLQVSPELVAFIEGDALPGTGLAADEFWSGLAAIFDRFVPRNIALLQRRAALQMAIDRWHDDRKDGPMNRLQYRSFLWDIGYLVPEPEPFAIAPTAIDDELARLAAPQLVVPVLNARFLLNAANARWGSIYDALYGTDAIEAPPADGGYDTARGASVIAWVKAFLDRTVPLAQASWSDWKGETPVLRDSRQLVGFAGDNILLRNNGLHIELVRDAAHPIGRDDPAHLADVMLESALSTIVDFEDSIAAVDAADKVAAYANWLHLMKGDLKASFEKAGAVLTRQLNTDRDYRTVDNIPFTLPGRSLLLVRNAGHLMTTPAMLLADGSEAPEGILDGVVTSLIALHSLHGDARFTNSRTGSIYIVKPKMHGPDEAAFANALFDAVEDLLGLERNVLKIGLMDEERRTSANLAACIHQVRDRIFFINTGFLDRTGDEIHTSMYAGPMIPRHAMTGADWLAAYEDRNVQIGLACGMAGQAQIGKGMWAAPDNMGDMLEQKSRHPLAGANTAWVPSPSAATLHATHYHEIDVFARQLQRRNEPVAGLDRLLDLPVADAPSWSKDEIRNELDNNAQGILGYVVRWIDQGIGCSKVPDIHDMNLMEDRATLRISSQYIANWLLHGICTAEEVEASLRRMAKRVDLQNAGDPSYRPLCGDREFSLAFEAARHLVFQGVNQPNGYTEPLLYRYRLARKGLDGD